MKTKTPMTFKAMTNAQLRAFIDGCHARREYDAHFDAACTELNNRA